MFWQSEMQVARGTDTVVEHLPQHPKVKGLSPAAVAWLYLNGAFTFRRIALWWHVLGTWLTYFFEASLRNLYAFLVAPCVTNKIEKTCCSICFNRMTLIRTTVSIRTRGRMTSSRMTLRIMLFYRLTLRNEFSQNVTNDITIFSWMTLMKMI